MVAARLGKDGYIKQIAGYHTDDNDTRVRQVSWAIFEVSRNEDDTCVRLSRRTEVCIQTLLVLLVSA